MSRSSVAEASRPMKSSLETSSTITRCSTPKRLLNSTPTSLSKSSRRATRTMLIPEAAICRANSLPIPDEAPVTSAQGPNLFLSSATLIFLLRSACLRSPYAHRGGEYRQNSECHSSDHLVLSGSFMRSLLDLCRKARDWYQIETWCKLRTRLQPSFLEVTAAMSSTEKRVRDDRVLLDLLADKWTIHVLGSLCDQDHPRRFNAIRRDVPGLSQKSLAQCLRRLEKSGLVTRRVLTTGRLGVEYAFTELGRTLERPVAALFEWTTEYADVVRAAQTAFEATAGGERDAA